ncbi:MAG: glycosyltransferase family 2 protein [Gemmatimonadaceae bacterium]
MPETAFGVVLLNWNGCDDTIAALDSLIAADPTPKHVVVVDNGSTDESLPRLRNWATARAPSWTETSAGSIASARTERWLLLVGAGMNLGFSGGNNLGLGYLATIRDLSHFLLLNNDAMVAPDYFAQMRDVVRAIPDAALIGCMIYYHPDRERIWFAGGYEIQARALVMHRYTEPTDAEPHPTPFVTGCAMMISRSLFEAKGGLAEVYNPIYWEDGDYSFRARSGGWKVLMAPKARVYHRVGASGNGEQLTPRTAFLQNRNRGLYVRRNYSGLNRALALAYLTATKPARSIIEVARGRSDIGSAIFRGFVHGLLDPKL